MASQQFCLKWNNHTNNMLGVFENLLTNETFVDVTLACDGLSLKAHRMVLSACSPFFQSLFVENPCKHPVVILKDMNFKDLKAIIDFMYHGEVNVAQDQLSTLLKTAETLKVKGLAEVSGASDRDQSGTQDLPVSRQSPVQSMSTSTPQQQRRASSPIMSKQKRARRRKRSGDYSDDESLPAKIKEPASPEIEELSGDASVEGGSEPMLKQGFSSSQGPISSVNKSFSSRRSRSSVQVEEPSGDDYEPSKLLEQTLTTTPSMSSATANIISGDVSVPSSSGMEVSQIDLGDTTSALVPMSDSSLLDDDGSQDIKPEILTFDDSQTSPTAGSSQAMVYMDQPGTSYQDNLVQQDGQPQGFNNDCFQPLSLASSSTPSTFQFRCRQCPFTSNVVAQFEAHIFQHRQHAKLTQDMQNLNTISVSPFNAVLKQTADENANLLPIQQLSKTATYTCHICYRKFMSNYNMRRHCRNIHKIYLD